MVQRRNPFTIHNLPYGIVSTRDNPVRRCAIAYNDWAIDLNVLQRSGLFVDVKQLPQNIFNSVSMPMTKDHADLFKAHAQCLRCFAQEH
jgi:hypothetical protein